MSWFDRVKFYYEQGLWDRHRVRNVVGKVITADEYESITSEAYTAQRCRLTLTAASVNLWI